MGFTHFDKVSGKQGVFVGAKGSEVRIDTGTITFAVNLAGASTAAEAAYIVVPYDARLVSVYADIASGTVGTGAQVSIFLNDTAGAALVTAASFTSAGTAGAETLTFAGLSTATISAVSTIAIVKASCATAYGATISVTATRVASTA